MRKTILALVLFTIVLLAPQAAHASGFLTARFGGEQGHPTTEHVSAIYFNPAGLALGRGTRLGFEGIFAYRSARYERPPEAIDTILAHGETGAGTPADAVAANSGEATLGNVVAAPFLGVASDLGVPNLGVGIGLYVPFGGSSSWDTNPNFESDATYPGAVDGVQRWHSIEGSIRSVYATAAGAYRIPGARLAFGLGLNVVHSSTDVIRARNVNGTDDLVTGSGTVMEGRSLLQTSGTDLALGIGAIWEPFPRVWVGASYQSQPGFGETTQSGTLTNKFGAGTVDESEVELVQALPDVVRLGVRARPNARYELRLFGEYVRWSVFDKQCILDATDPARRCALTATGEVDTAAGGAGVIVNNPRHWQDAFGVRAGGSYFVEPGLELYAGGGYDANAVPDDTIDAGLMDMDKLSASLGARWALRESGLAVAATYTQIFYFERTVAPRTTAYQPPSRHPDPAGTYRQSIGALNVGVEYAF